MAEWSEVRRESNRMKLAAGASLGASTGNLTETINRVQMAERLRKRLEEEKTVRAAGIRVATEEANKRTEQEAARNSLRARALAGQVNLEEAVASGDPEVVTSALTYTDISTIPTLDSDGLRNYIPHTEQGRILWTNRMAAVESQAKDEAKRAADEEKAKKDKEAADAEEVLFRKIREGLRGQEFTTLGKAVDYLEGKGIDVPTQFFPKVKDYVVSQRLAEKTEMEAADRAERMKVLASREKRLNEQEARAKRAEASKDSKDARYAWEAAVNAANDALDAIAVTDQITGAWVLRPGFEGDATYEKRLKDLLVKVQVASDKVASYAQGPGGAGGKPKDNLDKIIDGLTPEQVKELLGGGK